MLWLAALLIAGVFMSLVAVALWLILFYDFDEIEFPDEDGDWLGG